MIFFILHTAVPMYRRRYAYLRLNTIVLRDRVNLNLRPCSYLYDSELFLTHAVVSCGPLFGFSVTPHSHLCAWCCRSCLQSYECRLLMALYTLNHSAAPCVCRVEISRNAITSDPRSELLETMTVIVRLPSHKWHYRGYCALWVLRVCACLVWDCAFLFVGSGLTISWSPEQGFLPTVYRITKLKRCPWANKGP
jgi:hypothetical protein